MSAKLTNAIARARKILVNRATQERHIEVDIVFVSEDEVIAPPLPNGREKIVFRIRETRRPDSPPVVTRGRHHSPPSKE